MQTDIMFQTDTSKGTDSIDQVFDSDWIKTTFLLSDNDLQSGNSYAAWIIKNRYRSSADAKFVTTGIGLNVSCNARPQFTRYADIRSKGKIASRRSVTPTNLPGDDGFGMGRYYSEAIDDNAQRIYMRFGIPQYLFITSWLSNVFDPKRAIYANRGLIMQFVLDTTDAVTSILSLVRAPFLALGMLALNALNTFTNNSSSRFYSVKPDMHSYWMSVEDILNSLLAKRTLLPTILPEYTNQDANTGNTVGAARNITAAHITELHRMFPTVFDENGKVSVFGLALRAQRLFNQIWHDDYEKNSNSDANTDLTNTNNFLDYPFGSNVDTTKGATQTVSWLFNKAHDLLASPNTDKSVNPADGNSIKNVVLYDPRYVDANGDFINVNNSDPDVTMDDIVQSNAKANQSKWDSIKSYFLAELTAGAAFAVFTVDSTGSIGESFQNSTQDNPLKSTLNGLSSKARQVTNIASGALEMPVIGSVVKGAADVMATVASNYTFGLANPLLALLYGINMELPKTWESSSASFPKASYKIKLATPYGNAMSQLLNIYLPMAMIIAGSFPRGTGSQSYGSPYICQLYDRGRTQVTLGIIDSVSITRGTSNLPFTKKGQVNAIDIDFSVANLDSVMFTPISSGGFVDQVKSLLSPLKEDNSFNDYITSIAGLDVMTQVYGVPKLRLALATSYMKLGRYLDPDPAYFGSMTAGMINSVTMDILANSSVLHAQ